MGDVGFQIYVGSEDPSKFLRALIAHEMRFLEVNVECIVITVNENEKNTSNMCFISSQIFKRNLEMELWLEFY